MTKSQSEIIWSHTPMQEYPSYWHESDIEQMMEEYAKQQIISYEIWMEAELNNDSSFNYGKTPEQLYDLFQLQQNNKS